MVAHVAQQRVSGG